ncbi:GNAT family N-acetyltransferase [Telmatobacter sp. DSM 110680]|uniref:GNAT family N-acetyltransferase n=1 Tax=Telmatobacter sp. DSM 110680 TaxID=3036704 RepID=A0AAU7DN80_9BACT
MAISIRPAAISDAAAIAHVHVESWQTTYAGIMPDAYLASLDETLRARLWSEWLTAEALVLVAELNGHVVGFAHAGPSREPIKSCDAELYSIYLLQNAQKRGTGSALLRAMATALLQRSFKSMAVWVLEQNRSRNFYERTGGTLIMSQVIEVGGTKLMEVAYAWPDLKKI